MPVNYRQFGNDPQISQQRGVQTLMNAMQIRQRQDIMRERNALAQDRLRMQQQQNAWARPYLEAGYKRAAESHPYDLAYKSALTYNAIKPDPVKPPSYHYYTGDDGYPYRVTDAPGAIPERVGNTKVRENKAASTTVNVGQKAPPGYRWKDNETLEAIPGGPAAKLSPEQAAKLQLLETGQKSMEDFKDMLFKPDGSVDYPLIATMWTRMPWTRGRTAYTLVYDSVEAKLRAESGAAVPETEVSRMAKRFVPSPFDNEQTIAKKVEMLSNFLGDAAISTREGRRPSPQNSVPVFGGMTESQIDAEIKQLERELGLQ